MKVFVNLSSDDSVHHGMGEGALTEQALIAPLLLGWWACYRLIGELRARRHVPADWRLQILLTNTLWGGLATVICEGASWAKCLTASSLFVLWLLVAAIAFLMAGVSAASHGFKPVRAGPSWPRELLSGWTWDEKLMLGVIALVVVVQGIVAFATPSTNYDSLTYHLPRVMHWIQNHSVAHYPTSDTRQLESGPWAAFVLANLHLLSGGDRFANLLQWWMMASSVAGASLFAQQLTRVGSDAQSAPAWDRRAALLAGMLVATLPTGIVQAITTQTDYVAGHWTLCLAVFMLALCREPHNLLLTLAAAAALSLGLLSKATFVLYAVPLAGVFGLYFVWRAGSRVVAMRAILICGVACLVLNAPHALRNVELYGSSLGSRYMFALQRNKHVSLGGAASVAIRNLSLHAATGWAPATSAINKVIRLLHDLTGRDLNDPSTTIANAQFAFQTDFKVNDNQVGDFHHFALVILAAAMLTFTKLPGRRIILLCFLIVAVSFLVSCVLLRWQPWHARLQLPYFLLLLPAAAVVIAAAWPLWLRSALSCGLLVIAVVCMGWNRSRPLLKGGDFLFQPREQQYFVEIPELYTQAAQVADDIVAAGCQEIGLRVRHDYFKLLDEIEYPIWVLLQNRGWRGRIHHVSFENESAALPQVPFARLDAVVTSSGRQMPNLTRWMPFRTLYDPFAIHWTDRSSRWASVTLATSERMLPLPRSASRISLQDGAIRLVFHSGRPGLLRLRGYLGNDGKAGSSDMRLFTKSFAGYVASHALSGGGFETEVPLPGGSTALIAQLLDASGASPANGTWEHIEWRWKAVDTPLPWAYLTKVTSSEKTNRANVGLLRLGHEPTVLQLLAGADGGIDLLGLAQFDRALSAGERQPVQITSQSGQSHVVYIAQGRNMMRVPVVQGPNAVKLAWLGAPTNDAAAHIDLTDLELRFRP